MLVLFKQEIFHIMVMKDNPRTYEQKGKVIINPLVGMKKKVILKMKF